MAGLLSPTYLSQISVQKVEMNNGVQKFLITFPEPKIGTECYFAILYFDENNKWYYYTLEKEFGNDFGSKEGSGLVCGQVGTQHLNYQMVCDADMKKFELLTHELYDFTRNSQK